MINGLSHLCVKKKKSSHAQLHCQQFAADLQIILPFRTELHVDSGILERAGLWDKDG